MDLCRVTQPQQQQSEETDRHQQQHFSDQTQTELTPESDKLSEQMLEVCSPVISSTSSPEQMLKMKSNYMGSQGQQHDNIGSIITMLIDDQGADLDEILTDNGDGHGSCRERTDSGVQIQQSEIKEESCLSDTLNVPMSEYQTRQYAGSPDYYYQRDYVSVGGQDNGCSDRDIETRSSLSSNSEGDDSEMCRYNRGYHHSGTGLMSPVSMMTSSPYMITRDTGQSIPGPPLKKDDKYWERRRKNNLAAKKSRDARRVRENQLRLRVLCLENANRVLREQMDRKEMEVAQLRERLSKYETVSPPHPDHQNMTNMTT